MQLVYRQMIGLKRTYVVNKFGKGNMWKKKIAWILNDNMNGIE